MHTMKRQDLRILRMPETMMGCAPVEYGVVRRSMLRGFSAAWKEGEKTNSEKPLQAFLERHPVVLVSLLSPHRVWVFPRQALGKALGGGWQPDFLLCDWTSNGPEWTIVELESPTAKAINTRGISHKCRQAQQQISDYRTHLKENWQSIQVSGLIGTQQQKRSWIIIGQRENYDEKNRKRLIDLRTDDIEVASYARLYGQLSDMVKLRSPTSGWNRVPAFWKATKT